MCCIASRSEKSPASRRRRQGSNSLSKKFNDQVPDHSGNQGNHKIVDRENIVNGEKQALAVRIAMSELSHQKV
jgi:hypothetical protein